VEHTDYARRESRDAALRCCRSTRSSFDFNDRLKSITHGYGSMDYELGEYRAADLVKMDILVNGDPVDALRQHRASRTKAEQQGRAVVREAGGNHPAADVQGRRSRPRSAARSSPATTCATMRKDVTAKCYGGDISRKRKLLDKQKEGKKDETNRQGFDPTGRLHQGPPKQLTP
jgi:GTP-binding protein LepA